MVIYITINVLGENGFQMVSWFLSLQDHCYIADELLHTFFLLPLGQRFSV